jgi:hypothetical protein
MNQSEVAKVDRARGISRAHENILIAVDPCPQLVDRRVASAAKRW